jgi:predicted RNase H-like nuclease (RuvC/YqgF family)
MGITEKMWDGITTVIGMNDKVERLSATVKSQQDKIVALTERLIRLEALVEIGLSGKTVTVKRLEHKG